LNNDLYEALIEHGLPRLPEGYFYKFQIADHSPHGYFGPLYEKALHVDIYKRVFKIFWKHQWSSFQAAEILADHGDEDRYQIIQKGYATKEELDATTDWLPQHLAYLGAACHTAWQADVKKKADEKAAREKRHDRQISQFLNRRLP
jgi:hypothetical protein